MTALVALVALVNACGGDDGASVEAPAPDTISVPSSAVAPVATVAPGPPTTGIVFPETTLGSGGVPSTPQTDVTQTGVSPIGSSTAPATAAATTTPATVVSALDDGTYFGYVHAIDAATSTIALDTARWLTGLEADEAACAEFDECDGAPNGYFVENLDLSTVTLTVADGVRATVQGADGRGGDSGDLAQVDLATWATFLAPSHLGSDPEYQYAFAIGFDVTLEGGVVTAIVQRYQP